MLNTTLLGPPGTAVYQDYYGGHYRKENSHPCNDAVEIQIRMMLFDLKWVRASKGAIM
jgi:hypothetical protein